MEPLITWFRDRPRIADLFLALLVATVEVIQALAITTSQLNDDVIEPTHPIHWLIILSSPVVIVFRRTRPLSALFWGTITTMAAWLLDLPLTVISGMIVLYSAIIYGPKNLGVRSSIASAVSLSLFAVFGVATGEAAFYVLPLVGWTVTLPIGAALYVRSEKARLEESNRRLSEAEERRLADKLTIIRDERNRVARELHDVVAHGLSVIVVQAGAGKRVLDTAEMGNRDNAHDKVRQVISSIDNAARQSLEEMRQILGLLRDNGPDGDAQWQPTPGATTITELVARASAEGLDVSFSTVGEPRPLPTAVGTATYRIVQEALTNVRKHGGPKVEASVTGTFAEEELTIVISDNGRGAAAPDRGGHGLIGMRERAELLGGTFQSGPRVGGGFEIRVNLPIGQQDAHEPPYPDAHDPVAGTGREVA